MEYWCIIFEMLQHCIVIYFGVETVYFIKILYFGVVLKMFEWLWC